MSPPTRRRPRNPLAPRRHVARFGGSPAPSGVEGPPNKELHHVTSPDHTPVVEDLQVPAPRVRRSTRRWHLAAGLFAVIAIAFTTSACTPEMVARDAINTNWGTSADCATRIAMRESRLQPTVVNPRSGTTGLFQLHPVHAAWIKSKFGYAFSDMKDPYKNAKVAKALSAEAARMYGDAWQPWRYGGTRIRGGGCPA